MTIHIWARDTSAQENCHPKKSQPPGEAESLPCLPRLAVGAKSNGDLRFRGPFLEMVFDGANPDFLPRKSFAFVARF
jgi:hypothetical protein